MKRSLVTDYMEGMYMSEWVVALM